MRFYFCIVVNGHGIKKCFIVLDLKDLVVQIKYRCRGKSIDVYNVPKRICSMHDLLD